MFVSLNPNKHIKLLSSQSDTYAHSWEGDVMLRSNTKERKEHGLTFTFCLTSRLEPMLCVCVCVEHKNLAGMMLTNRYTQ